MFVCLGIALACHVAVKNKEGLYAVRFLLGLVSVQNLLPHACRLANT